MGSGPLTLTAFKPQFRAASLPYDHPSLLSLSLSIPEPPCTSPITLAITCVTGFPDCLLPQAPNYFAANGILCTPEMPLAQIIVP